MRRFAFAAAVCGTLALAACSDQTPTEPTAPPPEQIFTGNCKVARFPLAPVLAQIKVVFKPGKQQLEALARAATIKLFWDTCHPEAARRLAISFIEWMNRNFVAGKLRGTSEQVNRLTITILNGVGVTSTLPESAGETGVALYTDNAGALAKTTSGTSLVLLEPQSFNDTDPRLVRITRLFDDFVLQFFEGRQFPPYFDIDVIKLSGPTAPTDKVLKAGEFAIAATCLFDTDDLPDRNGEPQVYPPPSNIRLGHNPVPNAGQPNFEILDPADLAAAGLDDDLNDAVCARLRPAPRPEGLRIGGFGRGLPGLANAAWTTTRNYLAPAASALFLPEALHAATLALIKLPPPAGRAPSLSPFGVVEFPEVNEEQPLELNLEAVEKLPGGTQRFTVQSGAPGPYIWSVNGVDGGNLTFGLIVVPAGIPNSADYTAPGAVPTPATFQVCARRQVNPLNTACASVTIQPVPSSGADIIVFNDLNMFDNTTPGTDPNNVKLYANLVSYTGSGLRAANTRVLVHRGHDVRCDRPDNRECSSINWSTFESTMRAVGSGYTVDDVDDLSAPLTAIPANVKVVILVLPMTPYSAAEINAMKVFAGQGGRIVFVGEWDAFYGAGIEVENVFLTDMGAEMRNTGGAVDCGAVQLPATSLRAHQVTTDLNGLTIACASVVDPGPNDYPLFYNAGGTQVLGAVAKIDLTPLPSMTAATLGRMTGKGAPSQSANVAPDVEVFSWGFRPRE